MLFSNLCLQTSGGQTKAWGPYVACWTFKFEEIILNLNLQDFRSKGPSNKKAKDHGALKADTLSQTLGSFSVVIKATFS